MRLLHARHDHDGGSLAAREAAADGATKFATAMDRNIAAAERTCGSCAAVEQRLRMEGGRDEPSTARKPESASELDRSRAIRIYEEIDYDELLEPVRFSFALDRRSFVQMLGAGVMITAIGAPALAQRRGGRGRGGFRGGPPAPLSARFHFADDGTITVFSGKVEGGQGARDAIGSGGGRRAARAA